MKQFPLYITIFSIIINVLNIITGSIYLANPSNSLIWNINGLFIIFTIMFNYFFLSFLNSKQLESPKQKSDIRILSYLYFVFSFLSFIVLFFVNFTGFTTVKSINVIFSVAIVLSLLFLFSFPAFISLYWLVKKRRIKDQLENTEKEKEKGTIVCKIAKVILLILALLGLSLGIVTSIIFFAPRMQNTFFFLLSVFVAPAGIFIGLIVLNSSSTLINISNKRSKYFKAKIALIVVFGLTFTSLSFVPAAYTPYTIKQAELEFSNAFNPYFGGDWKKVLENSGFTDYFLDSPFQLTGYFLGIGDFDVQVITNVLYFDGSKSNYSVDKDIKLYFDAYLPKQTSETLPGKNSTIIRIHGGGWVLGDKGQLNVQMMNRYLAAQGYCVFDIQYGLNNETPVFGKLKIGPENVYGQFTIDDMIRQIGNFTFYLEEHAEEYRANLDKVFISGSSAGGQLALATALSIDSGNYTEIFSNKLRIKGIIPYYPANNVKYEFATKSREEWANPSLLINNSSPPCLIFQGEKDRLIEESELIKNSYLKTGRTDCALLTFPYAGHAADIYFPGHFNQVFLYYMERFLYLYNS
ncbi:MAG: alpha/beta hydrolase [Candidatus Heimdallarchaeaceae archaeon]